MNGDDQRGLLHLELNGKWSLYEMADFFQSLRYAHASINVVFEDITRDHYPGRRQDRYAAPPPKRLLYKDWLFYRFVYRGELTTGSADRPLSEYYRWHREYTFSHLWPNDDLFLEGIHLASEGWMDVIGKWDPLQTIKDYFLILRDWKQEQHKSYLQNQLLENQVIRERIAILKEAGFSETEIRDFVNDHIRVPLNELRSYQEKGLVTGADLKKLPSKRDDDDVTEPLTGHGRRL
jgi:hypothetical protein